MILFALLLTSSDPVPLSPPPSWVDYPPSALRNGEQGTVRYRVTVNPAGTPIACDVTASSGFETLDGEACRQIIRHGRFRPAMNEAGEAVSGSYAGSLRWSFQDE